MKKRGLALVSGGLDSILAALLIKNQGVEVKGIHFLNGFETGARKGSPSGEVLEKNRLDTKVIDVSRDFLEVVKRPEFGYGSSVNPCIDCRLFMLEKAGEILEEEDAGFLVTGEVIGQRPMTQNRQTIELIEERSGLEGMIVRPLSAKLLPPSLPEEKGLIDREKLLDIEGRSRKRQLELADEMGLEDFEQPAGGCLLTDPNFCKRVKELWKRKEIEEVNYQEMMLLKYGRHFRLPDGSKAIVGRDKEDNEMIDKWSQGYLKLDVAGFPSPLTLLSPEASEKETEIAARLTAGYSQAREEEKVEILVEKNGEQSKLEIETFGPNEEKIREELII